MQGGKYYPPGSRGGKYGRRVPTSLIERLATSHTMSNAQRRAQARLRALKAKQSRPR